jgi:uncharacterized membrane protein YecN with MAPEG domain
MNNGDLFYVFGIVLTVSAVVISFIGLRSEKFPGRAAPIVALWFVFLIGATTTFSVLHAQDEEKHEEAAVHQANEEAELEESQ